MLVTGSTLLSPSIETINSVYSAGTFMGTFMALVRIW
jgi:hypothetical protein